MTTLKDEIKVPDQPDPSIFQDADEDDSPPEVRMLHSLRTSSDYLRFPSSDSGMDALAAAALRQSPVAGPCADLNSASRTFSDASMGLGIVSFENEALALQQGASAADYFKRIGLLKESDSKTVEGPDPQKAAPLPSPSSPPPEEETEGEELNIKDVREWDILSGRGGKSNHHPGNKRFRQVVEEMKAKYRTTNAKTDKTALSKAIVAYVHGYQGRFLKKISASKWQVMSNSECRKKTSQALRETKQLKWKLREENGEAS